MDEMIYVAMTGAKQVEYAQAINTNNLANISTTGFRADLHSFSSVPVDGPGVDSRINAVVESYGTDLAQGATINTGGELDVAIKGPGFIAVQAPDGSEAYTRAGDLRHQPGGLLATGAGYLVMGEGGPVALPPSEKVTVAPDGTISVRPLGQGPETQTIADRIRLVNPDPALLSKGSDGLFYLEEGALADGDASVKLEIGALESSNVNAAKTLVNMIELSRLYEMQINTIKAAEENADTAATMTRLA